MKPARKKTMAKMGTMATMRRILSGEGQRDGGPPFGPGGAYWVCWLGLLKCFACRKSWTPEERKVTKVKAPQRTMVNAWKVKRPTTWSAPEVVAISNDSGSRYCCC